MKISGIHLTSRTNEQSEHTEFTPILEASEPDRAFGWQLVAVAADAAADGVAGA